MLGSLLRLQLLAFRRAPFFGGRLALAGAKTLGMTYAVVTAGLLGFLLPDTLSVWAPHVDVLAAVERALLPALGALTVARVLFQDVPTRGAEAFLLLPVDRRRVARAVAVRSVATMLNAVPLVFMVPFAARTIRGEAGAAAAWASLAGVAVLVALSHVAVVVYKTRLGERPVQTAALVGGLVTALVALDVGLGGLVPRFRAPGGGVWIAALAATTAGLSVYAYRGLLGALSLDHGTRPVRRRAASAPTGFTRPGVRAFLELDAQQLRRTRYPRGIVVNAFLLGVALTAAGLFVPTDQPVGLLLVFAVSTVAVSAGQFAMPFASGHYDRFLTLPGALPAFVRAKLVELSASVLVLATVQVVLGLGAAAAGVTGWAEPLGGLGAGVLFGVGVLAPVSLFGSSLAPKPLDTGDRVMLNYKVQSLPAQAVIGATSLAAVGLVLAFGPHLGLGALTLVGALGVAAMPLWERLLVARLRRSRHSTAARFRATL